MEGQPNTTETHTAPEQQNPEQTSGNPAAQAQGAPAELTDEQLLELVNSRFGANVKTPEDFKQKPRRSKEEIEREAEETRRQALAWGLQEGKIKNEDIEKAISSKSKTDRQIALELFAQEVREDNDKISDEEIEALFQDHYREELAETDPQRKIAEKRMKKVAESYRQDASKSYNSIEEEYKTANASKSRYDGYVSKVKQVAGNAKAPLKIEVPFTNPDGSSVNMSYDIELDDVDIQSVVDAFASQDTYKAIKADQIDLDDESIRSEIVNQVLGKSFPKLVQKMLAAHGDSVQKTLEAHYKNIPYRPQGHMPAGGEKPAGAKTPPPHTHMMAARNQSR